MVSPALLAPSATLAPFSTVTAATIANPFGPLFQAPRPGEVLSLISDSRARDDLLRGVDVMASGAASYSSDKAFVLRQQLTDNARRIIQLDEDIAQVSNPRDAAILTALRSGVASESAAISQAARSFGSRASFIESPVAPALLAVSFASNVAGGKNLTEASTSTAFSFTFAWVGMRAATVACPVKTPVTEGICSAAGALAGGFGGQAVADQLKGAEDAINRTLKQAWKTSRLRWAAAGYCRGSRR